MPGGVAHKINDHVDQVPDSAGPSFSSEQFEELVSLLRPLHDLAVLMLKHYEHEEAEQQHEIAAQRPAADMTARSDSEQSSG